MPYPKTERSPYSTDENYMLLNKIIQLQEELLQANKDKYQLQYDYSMVIQKENRLKTEQDQTQDVIYHENQQMKIQIEQFKYDNKKLLQSNEEMTIKLNQLSHTNKNFLDSIDDNFEIKNRLGTFQLTQINLQPSSYNNQLNDLKKYLKIQDTQLALSTALLQLHELNSELNKKDFEITKLGRQLEMEKQSNVSNILEESQEEIQIENLKKENQSLKEKNEELLQQKRSLELQMKILTNRYDKTIEEAEENQKQQNSWIEDTIQKYEDQIKQYKKKIEKIKVSKCNQVIFEAIL